MVYILGLNCSHGGHNTLAASLHPDNKRFWADIAVRKENEEGLMKEIRGIYGPSLHKEVVNIGLDQKQISVVGNRERERYPFLNLFIITSKNEHLFKKFITFSTELIPARVPELESYTAEHDRRCTPFEYSWARSRASYSNEGFKYIPIINNLGKYLDCTDLEVEFTRTQPFRDAYTPIQYDWSVLAQMRKHLKMETEVFETPFIISHRNRPNASVLEDLSKEMFVRAVYLEGNKISRQFLKQVSNRLWVSTYDFLRRTGISEVTDLVKQNFSTVLSKLNNESINNVLKGEKIYFRQGKRTAANWN